jgi:hypothetical protein
MQTYANASQCKPDFLQFPIGHWLKNGPDRTKVTAAIGSIGSG